jgi:CHASE2 domain-containing sensor protein
MTAWERFKSRSVFMWRRDPAFRRVLALALGMFGLLIVGVPLDMWSWWFPVMELAVFVISFGTALLL